jgi:hypothetical protein
VTAVSADSIDPVAHHVLGLDIGALLHQAPDSVHFATASCTMERRASKLHTSQSGRRQLHERYAAPLTHIVRGLDVGALLHQAPDSVHFATASCIVERRASVLRTSQSGRRQRNATLCSPANARCSWPRYWRPSPSDTGQCPRSHC